MRSVVILIRFCQSGSLFYAREKPCSSLSGNTSSNHCIENKFTQCLWTMLHVSSLQSTCFVYMLQAFIIAFTSSFIERVFYQFHYHYNLEGFDMFVYSEAPMNLTHFNYTCWWAGTRHAWCHLFYCYICPLTFSWLPWTSLVHSSCKEGLGEPKRFSR